MTKVRRPTEDETLHLSKVWHDGWHDAHAKLVPVDLVKLRTPENFLDRLHKDLP